MNLQRQNSIYGQYPYNRLGVLPNAENLRLNMGGMAPQSPISSIEDTTDYPSPGATSIPTGVGVTPLDRLFSLVKDNTNSMVNLMIVVIILVVEHLVKGNLFTCPCEQPQNTLYGAAFLVTPAAALYIVGVMANNKTWIMVTGCCSQDKNDYNTQHNTSCYHIVGIITKACVAPLAWIIISFIDGQFYACAASSKPCSVEEVDKNEKLFMQSKSQIIGYVILMVSMFTAIFGMLLWRAFRPLSYEQHHYIDIYRVMERHEIHRQFEEHAQVVAKQNVREFLSKESRPKKDWDYIANVPSLTPVLGPNGDPPSMSPLNKLVQKERRESLDSTAKQIAALQEKQQRLEHRGVQTQFSEEYNRGIQTQSSGEYIPLEENKVNFDAV